MSDDVVVGRVTAGSIASRLDRLPMTRWHRRMVLLIGLGSFFNFYEVGLGSFLGVLLNTQWTLTRTDEALVVGAAFLGEMVGSLTLAPLADRLGRRVLFQINLIAYATLSLATAFAPDLPVFLLLRILTGVGLGAELTLVDTYLSELLPAARRGRSIAWSYTFGLLAVPVAGVLAKSATGTLLGIAGWRWLLALAAVGGAVVWLARRSLPESPRWLIAAGQAEEADRVLRDIERDVASLPWLRAGASSESSAPSTDPGPPSGSAAPAAAAGSARYRRRSLLMWAMWTLGPIGFYGFASIAPIVLLAKGFNLSTSLAYSALTAIGYPLGSLISVYLTERVERRALLIASTLAVAAFGTVFGSASSTVLILVAGTGTTLSSVLQSNVSHIYQAELFRSGNRSTSIGVPYSASRLISALLPLVAVGLLTSIGAGGMYATCAVLLVGLTVLVRVLGPRTNNHQLDTI